MSLYALKMKPEFIHHGDARLLSLCDSPKRGIRNFRRVRNGLKVWRGPQALDHFFVRHSDKISELGQKSKRDDEAVNARTRTAGSPTIPFVDNPPESNDIQVILAKNLKRFMAQDATIRTLPELREKAQIGYGSVQRAAAGKPENGYSNLSTLQSLAQAIGCRPWELLIDEEADREHYLRRLLTPGASTPSDQS